MKKNKYLIYPNIRNNQLTKKIKGFDENRKDINVNVIQEKALTIFLNSQEIVTLMTIGDHPKYLSIGYLPFMIQEFFIIWFMSEVGIILIHFI